MDDSNKSTDNVSTEIRRLNNDTFGNTGSFHNPFHDTVVKVFFIICYVTVFVTCIIGNTVVLFAIARSPRLRSMTNVFLANLAVADFCIGIFCVLPNLSTFLSQNWILGRVLCKIYYYVWNVSYTASIVILTMVAIERYVAITYPLKAKHLRTRRKLFVACIIIWMIAIVYNVPYLFFYDTISPALENDEFCYFHQENLFGLKGLCLANLVVWFIVPLSIIAFMYCKIGARLFNGSMIWKVRLRKRNGFGNGQLSSPTSQDVHFDIIEEDSPDPQLQQHHFTEEHNQSFINNLSNTQGCNKIVRKTMRSLNSFRQSKTSRHGHKSSSEMTQEPACSLRKLNHERRKVIRLLIAIVVSFAACVLPHHLKVLNHFWNIVDLPHAVDVYFSPISFIILYLNSVLNPILYALFSTNFRKAVKESLTC